MLRFFIKQPIAASKFTTGSAVRCRRDLSDHLLLRQIPARREIEPRVEISLGYWELRGFGHLRLKLTISEAPGAYSQRDTTIVERAKAEVAAAEKFPTIEEVRAALASIPGSLSQDVIPERGDY